MPKLKNSFVCIELFDSRLSYKKRQSREICVESRCYSVLEGAAHQHIQ